MNKTFSSILLFIWINSHWSMVCAHSESRAAEIDGSVIYISSVDKPIESQVQKLHTAIENVYLDEIYKLLGDHLDKTKKSPGEREKKLESIFKLYGFELEKLTTRNITQTRYLRRRAASQYLENSDAIDYKKQLEKLQKDNKLVISMPIPVDLEKPVNPRLILTKLDDLTIRAGEIESMQKLRLYQLRGELYFLRKRSLDKVIEKLLLKRAAHAQGKSLENIEDSLLKMKATEAQIDEFINSQQKLGKSSIDRNRAIPYINFRLRYSKREQLINSQKKQAKIKYLLYMPTRPLIQVDSQLGIEYNTITGGKKSKPVRDPDIVVFSNYRCDVCRQTYRQVEKLLKLHPKLTVKHYDFMRITDTVALDAALLTNCANRQGKYVLMKNYFLNSQPPLSNQAWLDNTLLIRFLKDNNLKLGPFNECLNDLSIQKEIAKMTALANKIGFTDPPAFLLRGIPLSGFHTSEDLFDKLNKPNKQDMR